jgi:hypothetical protein
MAAAETLETLLHLGVLLKDVYVRAAAASGGTQSWTEVMNSKAFKEVEGFIDESLSHLSGGEIQSAIVAVQAKQKALRKGRPLQHLSVDVLKQYSDLLDAEHLLVHRQLRHVAKTPDFFEWFVKEALPTLTSIAKVVVPLLL